MPVSAQQKKNIIVIGSGLGGISAAISLAQAGHQVEIFEKNEKIGGKLNFLEKDGYTFDLGPSILTLPQNFRRLFERSGRRMSDYFTIRTVRPHWRNFFEDGTVLDLHPDPDVMAREAGKVGESPEHIKSFLEYSARLYDLVERGYFQQGLDTLQDFKRFYNLWDFPRFDLLRSMDGAVRKRLVTPYFRDIFDFFIKYVGSSALRSPAFMNCLPTIQFRHDLWYVDGGMYNIARGLNRLMQDLGVNVSCNSEVSRIITDANTVQGVVLASGREVKADAIVCNMEFIPACECLLGEDSRRIKKLERKYEPACSGLVIDLGLDVTYPRLAHHNFFFSADQKKHFRSVFEQRCLPEDPTLYVVAAARSDRGIAPEGCDVLKILPHIPYIDNNQPIPDARYRHLKDVVVQKLERMGLTDLRKHIVTEHFWTPNDIYKNYYSNRGSIYGVVCDRFRNFGFKAPKQSEAYRNLFFAGGSVNPGGGMPMVALSGQQAAGMVSDVLAR